MARDFEQLYETCSRSIEHYIYCKVANRHDAQDVLQTVLLAGYEGLDRLAEPTNFKRWLLSIATNKIKDYYAQKAKTLHLPLEVATQLPERGFSQRETEWHVRDVLRRLPEKQQQILYLFYIVGLAQRDIALRLNLPLGTVKSRLNTAKKHFAQSYIGQEEEKDMKEKVFPNIAPIYQLTQLDKPIFPVVCEEVPGWLITARKGERRCFAFYDDPDRRCTGIHTMTALRNANIHGIDCVQIAIQEEHNGAVTSRDIFVRLTDTHCVYVADMYLDNDGVLSFGTFMDDDWLQSYEVGIDNCGRETHQTAQRNALLHPDGSITANDEMIKKERSDLIGRFEVTIGGNTYDTVAMCTIFDNDHMVLQYLDCRGNTILFRRFNRHDWKFKRYGALWTDKLPDSQRLQVNGQTFVHWYDCFPEEVL